jgi:putative tryptophan/tyrosine transport system substrate-binding protein
MRRRQFIAGLGSAVAWPMAVRAQQPAVPVIGLLCLVSFESYAERIAEFRRGLGETGFVEGRNVSIVYRSADGHADRLEALAADLVRQRVAVIFATAGDRTLRAAEAATSSIPIVFATGGDAVKYQVVTGLNRPDANVTGVSMLNATMGPKRLELMRDLLPGIALVGVLANPDSYSPLETFDAEVTGLLEAAHSIGRELAIFRAGTESRIEFAFDAMAQQRVAALLVMPDAFFVSRREQIVSLAARYAIPAMYFSREFARAGGLISYASALGDLYRAAGVYTGRILRGAKPKDLPILLPTKFELVVNLNTAKALGLTIPETLLATADEVIQ